MNLPQARTLPQWVDYIQTLHVREIDLSLERVAAVYARLYPAGVDATIISVAGTNGKGSTAELLNAMYRAAGYKVGKYTSPHLVNFNERFVIDGTQVSDQQLVGAFARVEQARAEIRLTFFEFGTLVAIDLFARNKVAVAVMEVGLGGRLDAVNIFDSALSIVTNVSIDHTAWLGNTIDDIAVEKIGIARPGGACVIGMREPPQALLNVAHERGIELLQNGRDFHVLQDSTESTKDWSYRGPTWHTEALPLPYMQAGHQLDNAATAIAAIEYLRARLPVSEAQVRSGLSAAVNPARCEIVQHQPFIIVDVAHNVASVAALAEFLATLKVKGRIFAVCGMLMDKEVGPALREIAPQVDAWYFASITSSNRGASAAYIEQQLEQYAPGFGSEQPAKRASSRLFTTASLAFVAAQQQLKNDDCLVVFGSFFIVGDILAQISSD